MQSFVSGPKSKQCIIISLAVIWLASLTLALPAAIFSHLMKLSGEKIPEVERIWDSNGTLMGPTHREILICYPFPQEFGPVYPKIVVLGRFLIHYCLPLLIIGTFYAVMAHHLFRRYAPRFTNFLSLIRKFYSWFLFHSVHIIPGHTSMRKSSSKRHRHPSDTLASNNVKYMFRLIIQ